MRWHCVTLYWCVSVVKFYDGHQIHWVWRVCVCDRKWKFQATFRIRRKIQLNSINFDKQATIEEIKDWIIFYDRKIKQKTSYVMVCSIMYGYSVHLCVWLSIFLSIIDWIPFSLFIFVKNNFKKFIYILIVAMKFNCSYSFRSKACRQSFHHSYQCWMIFNGNFFSILIHFN